MAAMIVSELPASGRSIQAARYPWDEWLNGSVWLIQPSDHEGVTQESFAAQVTGAASKRGLKAATRKRPEGVYIQAFHVNGTDKADDDEPDYGLLA